MDQHEADFHASAGGCATGSEPSSPVPARSLGHLRHLGQRSERQSIQSNTGNRYIPNGDQKWQPAFAPKAI